MAKRHVSWSIDREDFDAIARIVAADRTLNSATSQSDVAREVVKAGLRIVLQRRNIALITSDETETEAVA